VNDLLEMIVLIVFFNSILGIGVIACLFLGDKISIQQSNKYNLSIIKILCINLVILLIGAIFN